jgi:hypothetical protein
MYFSPYNSQFSRIDLFRRAATHLMQGRGGQDEYLLMTFAQTSTKLTGFAGRSKAMKELLKDTNFAQTREGRTYLWHAMNAAIREFGNETRQRKVLLILSDGGDNSGSQQARSAVEVGIRDKNIRVYWVFLPTPWPKGMPNPEELTGLPRIDKIANESGGRGFFPNSEVDLAHAMDMIATELDSLYCISYRSAAPIGDKKEIDIKLNLSGNQKRDLGSPRLFYRRLLSAN